MVKRQVFIDTETTGLSARQGHRIIELAAIETIGGEFTGRVLHAYLDPERSIDPGAQRVHGISAAKLKGKPRFVDIAGSLLEFVRDADCLMHNASFDSGFINAEFERAGLHERLDDVGTVICTLQLARSQYPGEPATLDALMHRAGIKVSRQQHSAIEDAKILAKVYFSILKDQHEHINAPDYKSSTCARLNILKHKENSISPINCLPSTINTYLAWTFNELMSETFKRNRPEQAHLDFPILLPLPRNKGDTEPLEGGNLSGPFIYFVMDGKNRLCYIGKSEEDRLFKRWVRPGNGGPATHYWTHSTSKGGNVFDIADGLRKGKGPYHLRFTTLSHLRPLYAHHYGITPETSNKEALKIIEKELIKDLKPMWNGVGR